MELEEYTTIKMSIESFDDLIECLSNHGESGWIRYLENRAYNQGD